MKLPETATLKEFADLARLKLGYASQLKAAGRLVLTDDGKRVKVADSLALIEATKDPSKAGVADRHAAERAAKAGPEAPPAPTPPTEPEGEEEPDDAPPANPHSMRRAKALADKEEALARKALREEEIELGKLYVAEEVDAVLAEISTTFRLAFENQAARLSTELAAISDEVKVRQRLREYSEKVLTDITRSCAAIGRREQP